MDDVLELVEGSNQRGGRMLSVVDLILAETFTLDQTAWLLGRIEQGASWLVGARPGGAGKTTIMSALLAMLPEGETVRLTDNRNRWHHAAPGECLVCYEIGNGPYLAYLWGKDLARFIERGTHGCRLVANLHADTLDEAQSQVCRAAGVTPRQFAAFDMFLPIRLSASAPPRVPSIHMQDNRTWREVANPEALSQREQAIASFLTDCLEQNQRLVPDVRRAWLKWRKQWEMRNGRECGMGNAEWGMRNGECGIEDASRLAGRMGALTRRGRRMRS